MMNVSTLSALVLRTLSLHMVEVLIWVPMHIRCNYRQQGIGYVAEVGEHVKAELQHLEAITVVCEFERIHSFSDIRRYG